MSDKYVTWLSNISKNDVKLVGEKGANLGELFNAKFPVPHAFVITTEAFRLFLKENKIEDEIKSLLKRINPDDIEDVNKKSNEVRTLIMEAIIPEKLKEEILEAYDNFNIDLTGLKDSPGALSILKSSREPVFVSIRSSLDVENCNDALSNKVQGTCTNIRGNRELVENIKKCFASVFIPQSILCRKKRRLEDLVEIAVVVQKMISSDKSGTIFSSNVTKNKDNISIEAIFGQGENSIPKKIKPDHYSLTREMEIIKEDISDKKLAIIRTAGGQTKIVLLTPEKSTARVLKTYEIKQLADFAIRIEEHFGGPQEIEFAIEYEDFYILRTRPIIASENPENENEIVDKKILPVIDTGIKVKALINSSEFVDEAAKTNCDGVGLIKLEKLILSKNTHPLKYESEGRLDEYQNLLEEELRKIAEAFGEKPIWVRTSDIRSDQYSNLNGSSKNIEKNPILGNHGIRFSLKHEGILRSELNAIKKISDEGHKFGVMIPQVASVDEVRRVKEIFNEPGVMNNVKLGIAIETPAAAILIKDICEIGIDFISFGIKNLAQLTLATDEKNENTRDTCDENSWAVLKLISRVIRECRSKGVQTSIYMGVAPKKELIEFLIKCQINSICVNAVDTRELSKLIRKLETGEDYIEEREVGEDDIQGGETPMEEEKVLKPETVTEEMGEVGEEVKPEEHSEENLKNPLEPEEEPMEQRNEQKEQPNEEPIDEEKPQKEDIFT